MMSVKRLSNRLRRVIMTKRGIRIAANGIKRVESTKAATCCQRKLAERRCEDERGRNSNGRDFRLKPGDYHPEHRKNQQKNDDIGQGCPSKAGPFLCGCYVHESAPFRHGTLSHQPQHPSGGKDGDNYPNYAKCRGLSNLKRCKCCAIGVVRQRVR